MSDPAPYLQPYLRAAQKHGAAFDSLLWASPQTQSQRFDAITAGAGEDLQHQSILDVGCGRGDLLAYLLSRGIVPASYIGLEAVPALAESARQQCRRHPDARIIEADFIADPARLFVGAQTIALSGTFNTMDDRTFYPTLRRAFDAAGQRLVFNFLSSPRLAAAPYLHWRRTTDVLRFARDHADWVTTVDDYLPGDCTIVMGRNHQTQNGVSKNSTFV